MAFIRRKVFVGPTMYWGFKGLNHYRDKVRDAAEAFINDDIGLERVISVSEHVTSNGPFSVSVWFRVDDSSHPSESQLISNKGLRGEPPGFDVKPLG